MKAFSTEVSLGQAAQILLPFEGLCPPVKTTNGQDCLGQVERKNINLLKDFSYQAHPTRARRT
jgi:hypothetical protein